jgi:hypothetical protein
MKKYVQFHLRLLKKNQSLLYLINIERYFFKGLVMVEPITPVREKIFLGAAYCVGLL